MQKDITELLTWDYESVMDYRGMLGVYTQDGLFNARVCAGDDKKYPVIEWQFNGENFVLRTRADYIKYGVKGFYNYIPSDKEMNITYGAKVK